MNSSKDAFKMLPAERKAAAWLASVYALRMFGMFMILPVFALHAETLPGGSNLALVGFAMGVYGLTQALMQIPLGWASDKLGRRPVIVCGLIVFGLGCWLGYVATTVEQFAWARALQGLGAISAALSAYLADTTRDEVRSKGMAMIGASIGVSFAISLVAAPVLYQWIGLNGLFALTGVLCVLAIGAVVFLLPKPPAQPVLEKRTWAGVLQVLRNGNLMRLNLGIFILHLTQISLFVVVPGLLVSTLDLPLNKHWQVYLPVLLGSFVCMLPFMIHAERKGRVKQVLLGAIAVLGVSMLGYIGLGQVAWAVVFFLFFYFIGFNLLEAILPSWVSRVAPAVHRGLALGVYNTFQALGLFTGGALGGYVLNHWGAQSVFGVILVCLLLWFVAAWGIAALPKRTSSGATKQTNSTVNV